MAKDTWVERPHDYAKKNDTHRHWLKKALTNRVKLEVVYSMEHTWQVVSCSFWIFMIFTKQLSRNAVLHSSALSVLDQSRQQ